MPRAMIVDDDPLNLRVLSAMLQMSGYEIMSVSTGCDAVTLVQDFRPNIIMMDLLMPFSTLDGPQAARAIRDLPIIQVPIVAVSAADTQTIRGVVQDGLFDAYLQKPITIEKLNSLLTQLEKSSAR